MPELISTFLIAGAALSVGTIVREVTKDGYVAAKGKIAELFGGSAADNLAVLEQRPTDSAARNALTTTIEQATPEQRAALMPLIDTLRRAFAEDPEALCLVQDRGCIDLNLTVGGDIEIARIDGVAGMDVQANAGGNFSLTDISMARSSSRGN
jgi:hypothetical protein